MTYKWTESDSEKRIESKLKDVETVSINEYTRDKILENIKTNEGYRVHGSHIYVDILNLDEMLHCTKIEGETCHKRTLRFLNQHYRMVHQLLRRVDAIKVDFHNQRLHAVVAKPYNTDEDAEAKRVHRSVAIAQLIIDVLKETGSEDEYIPAAKVRVGIDTGTALAVNNGRSGYREPLFLGKPANHAAKRAGGGKAAGIFLTNDARLVIGLQKVENEDTSPLTKAEIAASQNLANLDTTKDEMVAWWKDDMETNPIGAFEFTRPTPPLRNLDVSVLTPGNSRRLEAMSIYADIDGFTAYVDRHIEDNAEDVVRTLHVLRAEMDAVVDSFGGLKIRFIGDCLHGLMAEGTASETDNKETISTAVICTGAIRSSFDLCLEKLEEDAIDIEGLGIQIGMEFGVSAISRLGMKGARIRCAVSRSILSSEDEQQRCDANETAIGLWAWDKGTDAVREVFGHGRKRADLDYETVVKELAEADDETAKSVQRAALSKSYSTIAMGALERPVRPYASWGPGRL